MNREQVTESRKRWLFALVAVLIALVGTASAGTTAAKKQRKFHWPRQIESKVISLDGEYGAVYDKTGIYLTDGRGKQLKRLDLPMPPKRPADTLINEMFSVSFAFNRQGTRLAILTEYSYGEPMIGNHRELWFVQTRTRRLRKLDDSDDTFMGPGTLTVGWNLRGWSKDGATVLLNVITTEADDTMPQFGNSEETSVRKYNVAKR